MGRKPMGITFAIEYNRFIMASENRIFGSSIGRKYAMALSGFFLMVFLLQHMIINMTSVFSADAFNSTSHFMGTNPIIQYIIQPNLALGVLFHFLMGFYLERQNKKARPVKYAKDNAAANSSWMSRNMIYSGAVIFLFLGLHFYDFWLPELNTKFILGDMTGMHNGEFRYYEELVHKFHDPMRVGIYIISFVALSLHLMHGFQSAFQSVGFNHSRYTPAIKTAANIYAIAVPLGFVVVALVHFLSH